MAFDSDGLKLSCRFPRLERTLGPSQERKSSISHLLAEGPVGKDHP